MENMGLFTPDHKPLAEKMRPNDLGELVGQDFVTNKDSAVRNYGDNGYYANLVFWGPPGVGKTSLARILAKKVSAHFVEISAVSSGVSDIKKIIVLAKNNLTTGQRTILFIDEIHRFNKTQQDALLPAVESGTIILIGATTENPSFSLNNALLSRVHVLLFHQLKSSALEKIIKNATKQMNQNLSSDVVAKIISISVGDARSCLNILEMVLANSKNKPITVRTIENLVKSNPLRFDKKGDNHYNFISALIKSMRGSDVTASMYYLQRILASGEDPLFVTRRLIIFASEDIGLTDNNYLQLAIACHNAVQNIGMPEANYNISHTVLALTQAPKNRQVADILSRAKQLVVQYPNLEVPFHLRNASTDFLDDLGYAKDYQWQADFKHPKGFFQKKYLVLTYFNSYN